MFKAFAIGVQVGFAFCELFIKPSITIPLNVTEDVAPIGRKNAYKFESSFKVTIDESMVSPEYSYPSSVYILYLVE